MQQGSKGHFVWVVTKEGKAEQRPVVVGDWQGNNWFITEGLKGGEVVVVDGGLSLQAGAPVKIKEQASTAEPAPAGAAPKVAAEKKEPALGDK